MANAPGIFQRLDPEWVEHVKKILEAENRVLETEQANLRVNQRIEANQRLVFERYADLGQSVRELINILKIEHHLEQRSINEAFREWFEETGDRIERIEDRQNLILELLRFTLSSKGNGKRAALEATLEKLDKQPALDDLKRQLAKQQRNLSRLMERKTNYGVDAPLSLLNEIEAIEGEIKILQQEIEFGNT